MDNLEVKLTLNTERGQVETSIESARFTIGHSSDNDLVIDDPGLARRHALIESFDAVVQISDCGSENRTFVNGNLIRGGVALWDGDTISFGSLCTIRVSIRRAGNNQIEASNRRTTKTSAGERLTTPVIALAAVALILVVIVPIALMNKRGNRYDRVSDSREQQREEEEIRIPESVELDNKPDTDSSKAITIDEVERLAAQFVRRISSDDKPYVFPPYAVGALEEIRSRAEVYSRSPALANALNSISTGASALAAEARREGIEPSLVIYTALAEIEVERSTDSHASTARRILPTLLSLRKTFGTESADKSLILVAAYRMGGGTKKSHPLLRTLTRVVKNPLTDRNVWFLHEQGGLDDEAYGFVVKFLALGVIAENPRRFGVQAPPVAY